MVKTTLAAVTLSKHFCFSSGSEKGIFRSFSAISTGLRSVSFSEAILRQIYFLLWVIFLLYHLLSFSHHNDILINLRSLSPETKPKS